MESIPTGLFRKYVRHESSPEEEKAILEWLEESEDNPRYFAELLSNMSVHDALSDTAMHERREQMCARLNTRIDADARERRRVRRTLAAFASGFAAACLAALTLFFSLDASRRSSGPEARTGQEQTFSFANNGTSTRTLMLGDGTKVFLRPGSEICYNVTEFTDRREVTLEGDAYFDVARDSLRPLTVGTRNVSIKVLGTAFTVRSGINFPNTEVVLERGEVRLVSPQGQPMVNLYPDQKAVYDSVDGVVSISSEKAMPYVAQHFNLVALEDATLGEIIAALQKAYGVRIDSYDLPDADKRFYFNYLTTDSLADVLTVLEFISGTKFTTH